QAVRRVRIRPPIIAVRVEVIHAALTEFRAKLRDGDGFERERGLGGFEDALAINRPQIQRRLRRSFRRHGLRQAEGECEPEMENWLGLSHGLDANNTTSAPILNIRSARRASRQLNQIKPLWSAGID